MRSVDDEAAQHLTAEAAQGRRGQHSFRRSAAAHHGVNAGAAYGGGNPGGEIAIGNEADAGACFANSRDQLGMAGAVEDEDHQIVYATVEATGNGAEVVLRRSIEIERAAAGWTGDDLLHVAVGRVQQAAVLGG